MTWTEALLGFFGILFIIALVILMPCVLIWVFNTLFKAGILYTPINWVASFILLVFLSDYKRKGTK